MGIIGVGIDIVHVPRIISLVNRRTPTKLAARILSPSQLNDWEALSPPTTSTSRPVAVTGTSKSVRFLARFGGRSKRPRNKALFPHFSPTWKQLSVLSKGPGSDGEEEAEAQVRNLRFHLSVSHDGEYISSRMYWPEGLRRCVYACRNFARSCTWDLC